jgi:N-methylhydantoinase A
MRQIRVGPESAGSEPGPACYQHGGERPAVTDADLVLGRLDPDAFAGGAIPLSAEAAGVAVDVAVGKPLGLDRMTAAFGISEVVDENMANAARVHAVENGEDLASFTMIAFGGAAPLHAGRLCQKLGVGRFLVPPGAGVGSAIGFLRASFSFEATRSAYMRLGDFSPAAARRVLAELRDDAAAFVRACDPQARIGYEVRAYMRYVGQGWEIPVDLSAADAAEPVAERCLALFEDAYKTLFGRAVDGVDIEVTSWAVKAATPLPVTAAIDPATAVSEARFAGTRPLFDPAIGAVVEAGVVARDGLAPGDWLSGPAMVTESETTVVIPAGFTATMRADGSLEIIRDASARKEAAE